MGGRPLPGTFHHGAWLVTHVSGRRTVTARGEAFEAPPLLCATNMDAETRALVTTREDLVMVIRGPDGSRLAQHADGSRAGLGNSSHTVCLSGWHTQLFARFHFTVYVVYYVQCTVSRIMHMT